MRHRKRTIKLGMKTQHRRATLANLVSSLIKHKRITTTIAKAKATRSLAEKMVTVAKRSSVSEDKAQKVAARRLVAARLQTRGHSSELSKEQYQQWRLKDDVVRILFEDIAPLFKSRAGGYTRIVRLGQRRGDAADMAILEWTEMAVPAVTEEPKKGKGKEQKPKAPKKAKEATAKE